MQLRVDGVDDALADTRLLSAVRQALSYRKADGITVEAGTVRLSLKLGKRAAARTSEGPIFSQSEVGMADLLAIEQAAGGRVDLLSDSGGAAAA